MDSVDGTSAQLGSGAQTTLEEGASLLTVTIDTRAESWNGSINVRSVVASLLVFINAHLALHSSNKIAVIGYNDSGAHWIWPEAESPDNDGTMDVDDPETNTQRLGQFSKIDSHIARIIKAQIEKVPLDETGSAGSGISGALALALCYTARLAREDPAIQRRILVISASSDGPAKYVATMNSIFAAQKLRTPIDVCNFLDVMGASGTTFLQQAADFSGGTYLDVAPDQLAGLVQLLLSAFGLDPALRSYVHLATSQNVDFSAVCFVSKNVLEIGYVCSVCLCIMEKPPADLHCPVCGTCLES